MINGIIQSTATIFKDLNPRDSVIEVGKVRTGTPSDILGAPNSY
jgi:hypothetical protein